MALVPKITSPCPLRFASMPAEGRDFCGQCQRRVHNLDAMDAAQRQAFFAACGGEVCVAYTVRRPAGFVQGLRAGAAAVALGVSGMAFAQEAATAPQDAQKPGFEDVVTGPTCDPNQNLEFVVVGGTMRDVAWIDEAETALPERPTIAEIDAADWLPTPALEGD